MLKIFLLATADISIDRDSGGQDRESYHYDSDRGSYEHESSRTWSNTTEDALKLGKDAYEAIICMKNGQFALAAGKSMEVAQDIINLAPDVAALGEAIIDAHVQSRVDAIDQAYGHLGDMCNMECLKK